MAYRFSGLDPRHFKHLFGLDEKALAGHRATRIIATGNDGLPDRIELRNARAGEAVLLVNFQHHAADNPFRASHAVFIVEGAKSAAVVHDRVPEALEKGLLSIRAFDAGGMMIDADIVDGVSAHILIERLLANPDAAYLHAHFARRGCYAALVERAE